MPKTLGLVQLHKSYVHMYIRMFFLCSQVTATITYYVYKELYYHILLFTICTGVIISQVSTKICTKLEMADQFKERTNQRNYNKYGMKKMNARRNL